MSDHEDHDEGVGCDSSSSSGEEEEDVDRCPVCLLRFKLQPVGRPESCQHLFCLSCITQWSTVSRQVVLKASQSNISLPAHPVLSHRQIRVL